MFFEQIGLAEGAGDAIEEKELLGGEIAVGGNEAVDEVVPNLDGDLVGKEKALGGVVVVEPACGRFRGKAPEDVAGGEVKVIARAAEKFAQCALA